MIADDATNLSAVDGQERSVGQVIRVSPSLTLRSVPSLPLCRGLNDDDDDDFG